MQTVGPRGRAEIAMDENPRSGSAGAPPGAGIVLRYARVADARRDRLREFPRGIMARTTVPVRAGERIPVRIEVEEGSASISARGEVSWVRPIAAGTVAGLSLFGDSHRDEVKLDLLLGLRPIGAAVAEPRAVASGATLSVTMLQPNPVLRQVLVGALERFARERSGAALRVETAVDAASFVAAVTERHPDLAIIDCDGIAGAVEPLLGAVRSGASGRVPVIIFSDERSPRLQDRRTITMRKPVWMKGLLDTVDLLLRD
jgi:hypothetical protein